MSINWDLSDVFLRTELGSWVLKDHRDRMFFSSFHTKGKYYLLLLFMGTLTTWVINFVTCLIFFFFFNKISTSICASFGVTIEAKNGRWMRIGEDDINLIHILKLCVCKSQGQIIPRNWGNVRVWDRLPCFP